MEHSDTKTLVTFIRLWRIRSLVTLVHFVVVSTFYRFKTNHRALVHQRRIEIDYSWFHAVDNFEEFAYKTDCFAGVVKLVDALDSKDIMPFNLLRRGEKHTVITY